jgi:hypothetical protein
LALLSPTAALLGWQLGAGQQRQQQQQQTRVDVVGSLPSLVIIGRFLLQYVQLLQVMQVAIADPETLSVTMEQGSLMGVCSAAYHASIAEMITAAQQWLQAHSTQLAVAGYGGPVDAALQQLQQHLYDLHDETTAGTPEDSSLSAGQASNHSSSDGAGDSSSPNKDGVVTASLQEIRQTGLALCSMAVPCLCNNPACTNTNGPTELSLVSGRSCVCGGCRVAHYCSRACQSHHWKLHKPVCKALAAAKAAATATAEPAAVSGVCGCSVLSC